MKKEKEFDPACMKEVKIKIPVIFEDGSCAQIVIKAEVTEDFPRTKRATWFDEPTITSVEE